MWTLMIFVTFGGPSITIDGFSKDDDCRALGAMHRELVSVNPREQFSCLRTGRPAVRCLPDTRTYGRTADCITAKGANDA